jgi:hypothetical protein
MLKVKPSPKHHNKPSLCYFECRDWIKQEKAVSESDSIWHWICDRYNISNGCHIWLEVGKETYDYEKADKEIQEYLDAFREEFKEYMDDDGTIWCYITW